MVSTQVTRVGERRRLCGSCGCVLASKGYYFVAGIANAIAAFFGHRVGAVAMQDTEITVAVGRQMLHAGDKRLIK
jgi:hypothetical protein